MSGLAALGRFAGGLASGLERGQAMAQRQQSMDRQAKLDTRMDKDMATSDAAAAALKEANAAFASKMDMSKLQPGQQPDPLMLTEAYNARGEVFKRAGNFDGLMKNYAEALPYYTQVRNRAMDQGLAQFEADGDPIKLAQTVYPHIYDGKQITMAKAGKDGSIEFALSDGSKQVANAEKIVGMVKRLRMDPALAAKIEFESMKADAEAAGKIKVERVKADEERKTKGVELEGRKGLADVEHGYTMKQISARTAGDLKVKQTPGAAAAEPTERVLGEGQRLVRKGLDGSYTEVAQGNTKPPSGKVDWTGLAGKHYGDMTMGALGGSRSASPKTMALAVSAQEIYDANKDKPGMTPEKATELAAKQHGAVKPGAEE